MSPSRTHPTGLDRIIGIISFSFFQRGSPRNFFSDGNGRSSDLHPQTHGKRSSRKNVSDHGACRNKTLTAAGLSGLLTRFPFNHYALILPEAAEGGSEPIAGAKVL